MTRAFASLNPQEALHVAIFWKSAMQISISAVTQTSDELLHRLYLELSAMEDSHVSYLQSGLAASPNKKDVQQSGRQHSAANIWQITFRCGSEACLYRLLGIAQD